MHNRIVAPEDGQAIRALRSSPFSCQRRYAPPPGASARVAFGPPPVRVFTPRNHSGGRAGAALGESGMALQAGAVPFETGFQVCEALIDVCLKPGSHLLNQFRGRVKAAIHLVLSSVKAPPDLLIGQERSVPQWASRQRPGCWGKKSPRAPSVSNQTSRLVWKQDLQQMFQRNWLGPASEALGRIWPRYRC